MAATLPLSLDLATLERVVLCPEPPFTADEFVDFCHEHQTLRIEKSADGEIIIMSPLNTKSGFVHSEIAVQFISWAKIDGRGVALSGEAGITLPDSSVFAPDAFWVTREMWKAVQASEQGFAAIVPPFVIEVRSRTDRKNDLHDKMLTYLRNGVDLAWLIDPLSKAVTIYRSGGASPVELPDPERVSGEGPVSGFVLDLHVIYGQL